jgi:enoyl-CoA hydratase
MAFIPLTRTSEKGVERIAKATVLAAFRTTLDSGLGFERQAIRHAFATRDQAEGMNAFFEKREPDYRRR